VKRREFITLGGGAAAAWPLVARAQQHGVLPVVGFLSSRSPDSSVVTSFHQGLKETGHLEGQNVAVEYRWAEGHYDRLPALATEFVGRSVAVIAAVGGDPAPQAARWATRTIPIVFATAGDPVEAGLVASLNRPGGNATGVTIFGATIIAKRLALLRELVPTATLIGILLNPSNPTTEAVTKEVETAARELGQNFYVVRANTEQNLDAAFVTLVQEGADALLVGPDQFFTDRRDQIVALAIHARIPAIYHLRDFATAGGLISYGNSLSDLYRQVGNYVGRIIKGEKPADLPVTQPTKFELVINLKTAKALGLTVPLSLQVAADEVIE
jgi:putative ABC transport system substrate-binding protein